MTLTYNPGIFAVSDLEAARRIILVPEPTIGTDERWRTETPYLVDRIQRTVGPIGVNTLVLDYGCGIGRLAGMLIDTTGCAVIGVDQSVSMRALAAHYVNSPRFAVCAPEMLPLLNVKCDVAIATWVLQHCLRPLIDLDLIDGALAVGARLFVVNTIERVVPTVERGWVNDGIELKELLASRYEVLGEFQPEAPPFSRELADCSFIGVYRGGRRDQ